MTGVRIITEPLGGSPLSQLLQSGEAPERWFARRPATADEWKARAQARAAERDWTVSWNALAPAFNASGRAAERLARVRKANGVVITTGQQPGLFGGPIYTWSKAMSALALADEIERATGIATMPVFWAATDDADFAEAAVTTVARAGGVDVLRQTNAPEAGTPMSLAPLGDLSSPLARLAQACGSAADDTALAAVTSAYGDEQRTVADAYLRLLRTMLEPMGIAVLDASHASVRAASDTTLRAALRDSREIERRLDERGRELQARGLEPQVEGVAGLSLVFAREGRVKQRVPAGTEVGDAWLTPNVLLRPVIEHEILPTVAYMGGPGELAYFSQVTAVADAIGVKRPVAVPRWSCTLVEPHVDRLLAQFNVDVHDLARADQLEGSIARQGLHAESTATLHALRETIAALPTSLAHDRESLRLSGAVDGAVQGLLHRVDRLERRLSAGVKRRDDATFRDVATLRAALYPRGVRQERALNITPLLARHGTALLDDMRAAASPHARALLGMPVGAQ